MLSLLLKGEADGHSVLMSDSSTPWTMTCQTTLSMEFFRQEYWSVLPFPSPGNLPGPGIELTSVSPALVGEFFTTVPPGKPSGILVSTKKK